MPIEEIDSQILSTQGGACSLCRDIQRDGTGKLAELHDVRNHTHCGVCSPVLLAAEHAGVAICYFDDAWTWELASIKVDTGPHITQPPKRA